MDCFGLYRNWRPPMAKFMTILGIVFISSSAFSETDLAKAEINTCLFEQEISRAASGNYNFGLCRLFIYQALKNGVDEKAVRAIIDEYSANRASAQEMAKREAARRIVVTTKANQLADYMKTKLN